MNDQTGSQFDLFKVGQRIKIGGEYPVYGEKYAVSHDPTGFTSPVDEGIITQVRHANEAPFKGCSNVPKENAVMITVTTGPCAGPRPQIEALRMSPYF